MDIIAACLAVPDMPVARAKFGAIAMEASPVKITAFGRVADVIYAVRYAR